MSTFLSSDHQKVSLKQEASQRLFELLALQRTDDVLDLGCGPGHLTRRIRDFTTGTVFGVDPSAPMIAKARRNCQRLAVTFLVADAESFETNETFDVIFCNSSFQWFREPARALANCRRVLRPGGRIGIQAPARSNYCPNFIQAASALAADPYTRQAFADFQSPWFLLETASDYSRLFEGAGLIPRFCQIEEIKELCSPDKAMVMFESAAATAYLNPACYKSAWPQDFEERARRIIKTAFQEQALEAGKVPLTFYRICLLAENAPAQA